MNKFMIISPREEIIVVDSVPPELIERRLAGARQVMAKGDFAHMIFQHFKGDGFDIWVSNYRIRTPLSFNGGFDNPILEFHINTLNTPT